MEKDMETIVEQGLLFDFYGELLTDHQRAVYEAVIAEDLTYTEIAEEYGISRQAVFDLVNRCQRILMSYEQKLHLVYLFREIQKKAARIHELATMQEKEQAQGPMSEIADLSGSILKVLE